MNLVSAFRPTVNRRFLSLADLDASMDRAIGAQDSGAGVRVEPTSAMQSAVVYSCVNVLAQTIAALPLHDLSAPAERRQGARAGASAVSDPARRAEPGDDRLRVAGGAGGACLPVGQRLLRDRAQRRRDQWPVAAAAGSHDADARRQRTGWCTTTGCRTARRSVSSLRRSCTGAACRPTASSAIRPSNRRRSRWAWTWQRGSTAARFFGNDSRPGGVLTHPGKLSTTGAKRLKDRWEEAHRGLTNSQRVAVLEEGVDLDRRSASRPNRRNSWRRGATGARRSPACSACRCT